MQFSKCLLNSEYMPNTARDELYIANPEASSSVVTQVTPMGNRQPGVLELLTQ